MGIYSVNSQSPLGAVKAAKTSRVWAFGFGAGQSRQLRKLPCTTLNKVESPKRANKVAHSPIYLFLIGVFGTNLWPTGDGF